MKYIYLSWILSAIIRIFSIFVSGDDTQNHLRFLLLQKLIYDISVGARNIYCYNNDCFSITSKSMPFCLNFFL